MEIVETVAGMQDLARAWKAEGNKVALVPTMGALHRGHLSLVTAAARPDARVVASVFVNPLQFGPGEDFDAYPRAFDADCAMLEAAGVSAIFHPSVAEMYPPGSDTRIVPGAVAAPLEGERRPGHFTGVATVVARLFGASLADRAYFGQKDAQQLAVVRAMVHDLALPVEVHGRPTVRERDGLAMSSRNRYLAGADRGAAQALVRALARAQGLFALHVSDPDKLEKAMLATLRAQPGVEPDYVAVADPRTFATLDRAGADSLLLVAARVGPARLIDNARAGGRDLARYARIDPTPTPQPQVAEVFAWNA